MKQLSFTWQPCRQQRFEQFPPPRGIGVLHVPQDIRPTSPQTQIEGGYPCIIRLCQLPTKPTLLVEQVARQQSRSDETRVRSAVLLQQRTHPFFGGF